MAGAWEGFLILVRSRAQRQLKYDCIYGMFSSEVEITYHTAVLSRPEFLTFCRRPIRAACGRRRGITNLEVYEALHSVDYCGIGCNKPRDLANSDLA